MRDPYRAALQIGEKPYESLLPETLTVTRRKANDHKLDSRVVWLSLVWTRAILTSSDSLAGGFI